jgi:hypothetical protein
MMKVNSWSHGAGDWMFHDYFDSQQHLDKYIEENGYDKRFFQIEPETPVTNDNKEVI